MAHPLHIDPADPRPIWSQIEQRVLDLVAAGALAAGDSLPSVRELARELAINPATVARAYQRLAEAGVLAVRRGEGTFVASTPPAARPGARGDRLAEGARGYAALAVGLGVARRQADQALTEAWQRLRQERLERTDD